MDILVVPKESKKLLKVTLPRPKDGAPQTLLYDEDNLCLYEIIVYKDDYRSWFVDNHLCTDGHYKMLTRVDPLFVFLPQLMKYAASQFRPLGDVCMEFGQEIRGFSSSSYNKQVSFDRLDYALRPDIDWRSICDTQTSDDDLFVKYSESRTIEWLIRKHARLMESLQGELNESSSRATVISYALDLLDEYVPKSLSPKFREATRARQYTDRAATQPVPNKSTRGSSNGSRDPLSNPPAKKIAPTPTSSTTSNSKPAAKGIARFFTKKSS